MGLAYIIVEKTQITVQFTKVNLLEIARLQFDSHKAVQLTVEKKKVDAVVMTGYGDGILVVDKQEILAKAQDEFLDVVHYFLFHYSFVHFLNVAGSKFFNVDEIEHVLVLEGKDGSLCEVARGQFLQEIVWQAATSGEKVLFDAVLDAIGGSGVHERRG